MFLGKSINKEEYDMTTAIILSIVAIIGALVVTGLLTVAVQIFKKLDLPKNFDELWFDESHHLVK